VEVHLLSGNNLTLALHSHINVVESRVKRLLSSEGATLCQSGLATCGLAQNCRAAGADNDGLCVREDGCDGEAAGALDVHEE